jgi:hypothetical protein
MVRQQRQGGLIGLCAALLRWTLDAARMLFLQVHQLLKLMEDD